MKSTFFIPIALASRIPNLGYDQFLKIPSLNDHAGLDNCYWQGGKYGNYYTCQQNEVAVGVCGSGRRDDCPGGTYFMIECCDLGDTSVSDCTTSYTKHYGEKQVCDSNKVLWGGCGSGAHLDCSTTGHDSNVDMTCCNKNLDIQSDSCVWKWGKYGQQLSCPSGQIGHGICGSGGFDDCNGGKSNSGIYCCSYTEN